MSRRLTNASLRDKIMASRVPIGYVNGRPVFPIMGGAPDDDEGDDGEDNQDEEDDQEDDDASSKKSKKDDDTVSRAEYDRLKRRMRASDKNNSALQKRLDDLEAGQQSDADKIVAERDSLKEEVATLKKINQDMAVKNAFLACNDVSWHDPDDAYDLLVRRYMEDVEYDEETGEVSGMQDAIKEMADKKQHLVKVVKSSSDDDDDDEEDEDQGTSGRQMNGRRKGKKRTDLDDTVLMSKYPALRGRT